MSKFRPHADLIIEQAVDSIFPLPAQPDPARIEGVLTGFALALDAIGQPVEPRPITPAQSPGDAVEAFGEAVGAIGKGLARAAA